MMIVIIISMTLIISRRCIQMITKMIHPKFVPKSEYPPFNSNATKVVCGVSNHLM